MFTNADTCRNPGYTRRPAPGCGHGTVEITLRSNQLSGLLHARSFTEVGLMRVSIGPAMSVALRAGGTFPPCAITASAASTGTAGWQTAITWTRGPRCVERADRVVDVLVEAERPLVERDVAGVVPVGEVHVEVGEQRAHGVAQQRREVAGQRRDDEHRGPGPRSVLGEVQQAGERAWSTRSLRTCDLDAERRPHVREVARATPARTRRRSSGAARKSVPSACRSLQPARRRTGHRAERSDECRLRLVHVVEHSLLLPAARPAHNTHTRDAKAGTMADAMLTINSRNYGAWSLRGWLLCKLADLDVDVDVLPSDDPSSRAELMLLSPSFLVPRSPTATS